MHKGERNVAVHRGRGTSKGRGGRGRGTRGRGGGRGSSRAVTTTSRSQGSSADGSGPRPRSLPSPAATPQTGMGFHHLRMWRLQRHVLRLPSPRQTQFRGGGAHRWQGRMQGLTILTCAWFSSLSALSPVFVRVFSRDLCQAGMKRFHPLVKLFAEKVYPWC